MLSLNDALQKMLPYAGSFGTEQVSLDDSLGRTLAETVAADRDYPPFNRSAMDGIAIRYSDFESGMREFTVVETICAGAEPIHAIAAGECYKIMTGAAVPDSASAVIRKEDLRFTDHRVAVSPVSCKRFQNIALQGQDLIRDTVVLQPSIVITPAIVSLLATLGKTMVCVEKSPSISVFTTGNEVVEPGAEVSRVQIRNSNGFMIKALLRQSGINVSSCEHVKDDRAALAGAFRNRLSSDIIVVSGGVSAGDEDFVPGVLSELGVDMIFHKVAIKPGKPVWCGKMTGGPMVFALPGNPFSCLVTFKLFVEAFINCSFGRSLPAGDLLPLISGHLKKTRFDEFFPVKIAGNFLAMQAAENNGSGDIRLGMAAEAFALHAAEEENLVKGDEVRFFMV